MTAQKMGAEEGSGLAIFGFCHAVLDVKACARASRPVLGSAGGGLDGCAAAWGFRLGQSRPETESDHVAPSFAIHPRYGW